MTPRKRMLTAMAGGIPDRVPASPDTNWMIPAKLIGGPFWKVYRENNPPIWKAYNDCVKRLGIDGFSHHGYFDLPPNPKVTSESKLVFEDAERQIVGHWTRTKHGDLYAETTFLHGEPPTDTKKPVSDFAAQHEILREICFRRDLSQLRLDSYERVRQDMGDAGVVGLCMLLPTLLFMQRDPTEGAMYDYYDHHDLLADYMAEWTDYLVRLAHAIVAQPIKPDFVFFPNSGLLTMQSLDIVKEFSYPALQKLTRIFKQAGILTSLHSCGKERAIVELAATTDLNCIDPLEVAPMGDCDLAEIKQKFGRKLALKGNLHTTEIMLRMDPAGVEREARKCLEIGMPGGGFILGTGDQCGRDTAEANIVKLTEVCEKYGRY